MFRLTQEMEKMGMSKLTVAALIGPESDGCVVARRARGELTKGMGSISHG